MQEEFDIEDDWNLHKAAGVCMMLLATCCKGDIVLYVLPFVKDIKDADWRHRLDSSLHVTKNRGIYCAFPLNGPNRQSSKIMKCHVTGTLHFRNNIGLKNSLEPPE